MSPVKAVAREDPQTLAAVELRTWSKGWICILGVKFVALTKIDTPSKKVFFTLDPKKVDV